MPQSHENRHDGVSTDTYLVRGAAAALRTYRGSIAAGRAPSASSARGPPTLALRSGSASRIPPAGTPEPTRYKRSNGPRPFRSVAHRLPAHRRRAYRAVQLAVRAAPRRHVRVAHRGYRYRAIVVGDGFGDRRWLAVAGTRLGRGPRHRRPARSVFSIA